MAATTQVQRPQAAQNPWDIYAGVIPGVQNLIKEGKLKQGSAEADWLTKTYTPKTMEGAYNYAKTPAEKKLVDQYYKNFGTLGGQWQEGPGYFLNEYRRQLEKIRQGAVENPEMIPGYKIGMPGLATVKNPEYRDYKLPMWESGDWTDADLAGMFKYAQTGFKAPKQGPGFGFNLAKNLIMGTVLAPIGGAASGILGGGTLGAMGGAAANQAAMGLATTGKPSVNIRDVLSTGASSALGGLTAPKAPTGGTNMAGTGFGESGYRGLYGMGGGSPAAATSGSNWAKYLAPAVGGYITGGTKGAGTNVLQALLGQYGPKVFGQSDVGEAMLGGAQAWLGQEARGGNANTQDFLTGGLKNVAGQGTSAWNQAAGQAADIMGYQNQQNQLIQSILDRMGSIGGGGASAPAPSTGAPMPGGGSPSVNIGATNIPAVQLPSFNPGEYTSTLLGRGINTPPAEEIYGRLMGEEKRLLGEAEGEASRNLWNEMGRRGLGASSMALNRQADLKRDFARELSGASQRSALSIADLLGGQQLTQRGQNLQAGGFLDQLMESGLMDRARLGEMGTMDRARLAESGALGRGELAQRDILTRLGMQQESSMLDRELANRQSLANQASRSGMYGVLGNLAGSILGPKLFPQPAQPSGGGGYDDLQAVIAQIMGAGGGGGGGATFDYMNQPWGGTWTPPGQTTPTGGMTSSLMDPNAGYYNYTNDPQGHRAGYDRVVSILRAQGRENEIRPYSPPTYREPSPYRFY